MASRARDDRNEILDVARNPLHAQEHDFFSESNFAAMEKILDEQFAIITFFLTEEAQTGTLQLIIIDDFSAEPMMIRNHRLVNRLYTRGRHARISTITSVHRIKNVVKPIVRAQATALFIFRQKAFLELQNFIEESSATVGEDILEKVYRIAVAEPYQFLYVDLRATDPNEIFSIGFKQRIRVSDV